MSTIIKEISVKNPTGSDQKYEDTYLAIESEIDKTMSASSAGEVDWKLISEHTIQILEEDSKDLKIASYWLYSQWKLSSWDGLAFTLPLYTELLATYKLKLFPKSIKVKLRILEWLHENLSTEVLRNIDVLEKEKFMLLLNSLEELESTVIKVFEQDNSKVFSPLIRKLKKYNDEKKTQEILDIKIEPIEEKEVKISEKDEVIEDIKVDIYSLLGHKRVVKERLSNIKNEELLFDITQTIGFAKFEEAFSEQEKLKRSDFPTDKELVYLEVLKDKDVYIGQVKVYVSMYPCWLEGQYIMILRGDEKEDSKQYQIFLNTLKYKLINFISNNSKKLHKVQPKNYNTIGDALKKWVNLENKYLTISNSNSKYEESFQESLSLIKTKSKEEAVLMLDTVKKESKTEEESYLWTLKQVYLAFEIDNKKMAVALLQELNREIELFNLEKWKPSLAIEVYILLLNPSINKILNLETKELIYRKLCRLSPQEAMKIGFL